MKSTIKSFTNYAKNITSQGGEDGIISETFKRLEIKRGWCVEFGAWDGKNLSNTWDLWHNQNWKAILIEGDDEKASALIEQSKNFGNMTAIHAFVASSGKNSLDSLLEKTDIPRKFELLSIDVDGDDFQIWQFFTNFHPIVVVIEYNATFPAHMRFVDTARSHTGFGSSAQSLIELAEKKGYRLYFANQANLFFIRNDQYNTLKIDPFEIDEIFSSGSISQIVSTFGGNAYLNRKRPSHVETNTLSGISNQILMPIIPTKELSPLIVIDKNKENYYTDSLRFLSKYKKYVFPVYQFAKRFFPRLF